MASIKFRDRKILRVFLLILISIFVLFILLKIKSDEKEVYDLNNIILDMSKEELGNKSFNDLEYNLDQIKDTYKDLYYFYEPLSQVDINAEFESIINYELKVIDTIHQSTNLKSINGYNYSLNEESCFISFFKINQEFLYNKLMKDQDYEAYLWDLDNELSPPIKWYFNKMGSEISRVVKKDINKYITHQIEIEDINNLDKEMYIRIFKFETWIASKTRSSCGLSTVPDIAYE